VSNRKSTKKKHVAKTQNNNIESKCTKHQTLRVWHYKQNKNKQSRQSKQNQNNKNRQGKQNNNKQK
jgi:hypothetical protein